MKLKSDKLSLITKQWVRIIAVSAAVAVFAGIQPVFAGGTIHGILRDGEAFNITGTLDTAERKGFTAVVFSPQYTPGGLNDSNASQYIVDIRQGITDGSGEFIQPVSIPQALPGGTYHIRISPVNQEPIYITFLHVDKSGELILTGNINAASLESLKTLIIQYSPNIGIEFDGIFARVSDGDKVYEKIYAQKSGVQFTDFEDIRNSFYKNSVVSLIEQKTDAQEMIDSIEEYSVWTGIDLTVYEKLSDGIQIVSPLVGKEYAHLLDFKTQFDTKVGLAGFGSLLRGDMATVLDTYGSYLTFPSGYENWSDNKLKELYKHLEGYTSFSSFQSVSDAISAFNSGQDGTSPPSSGGGGGSASPAKTQPIYIDIEPKKPEVFDVTAGFEDLDGAIWALEAIEYLVGKKVLVGVNEKEFEPNRSITREEFVKVAALAFGYTAEEEDDVAFSDVPKDAWYKPFVVAASKNGILNGVGDNKFGTGQTITRQDMAVILYRIEKDKNTNLSEKRPYANFTDENEIASYAKEAVRSLYMREILNGTDATRFEPAANATRAMAAKMVYQVIRNMK